MRVPKIKQPLADRLVVKRDQDDDKTEAGIIIPELAKTKGNTGIVIAVGPGVTQVHPEDHVLFGRYSGTEMGELVVLREAEVMALLE